MASFLNAHGRDEMMWSLMPYPARPILLDQPWSQFRAHTRVLFKEKRTSLRNARIPDAPRPRLIHPAGVDRTGVTSSTCGPFSVCQVLARLTADRHAVNGGQVNFWSPVADEWF